MSYRLILEDDQLNIAAEALQMNDLDHARTEALLGYREILADHLRGGRAMSLKAIHIADELGAILASVTLRDALTGVVIADNNQQVVSA